MESNDCYRDIDRVMRVCPELGRDGWCNAWDRSRLAESRVALREAREALQLCRQVFRDRRFRKLYRGKQSDYCLKHVAEFWDLNFDPRAEPEPVKYNGVYVGSGVAVAAALLEGFTVHRMRGRRSSIVVPKPSPPPVKRLRFRGDPPDDSCDTSPTIGHASPQIAQSPLGKLTDNYSWPRAWA
jgi:hypothetical protein